MNKTALKKTIIKKQNGVCALTQTPLESNLSLVDTDRKIMKMNGGIYTPENTRIVDPVEHMKRHGNYRKRDEQLEELKTVMDARFQVMKLLNGTNNRILAMKRRTDTLDKATLTWLEEQADKTSKHLSKMDRQIEKMVKVIEIPVAQSALGVKGVGAITVANMLAYIDIEKAQYCSSLWSYIGIDKASHQRYEKGKSGGGNKTLRTALYTMATSMEKNRNCPYREVYDQHKFRLSVSEKTTTTRNTQGKLVEGVMWKDVKPSHRRGSSLRIIIKHFLADWWYVHRTTEGFDTPSPYVIEKLGHHTWIMPQDRGWKF